MKVRIQTGVGASERSAASKVRDDLLASSAYGVTASARKGARSDSANVGRSYAS